jgi:flagellar biosynthesis/type III secretory pathway protein FliH
MHTCNLRKYIEGKEEGMDSRNKNEGRRTGNEEGRKKEKEKEEGQIH